MGATIQAYFDESEAQDSSDVLAVSGFIFEQDACGSLDEEWGSILLDFGKDKDTPLPYFRMSACAHNNYPFDHLRPECCDAAARLCIASIRKYMTQGLSASISRAQFKEWLGR